MLKVMDNLKKSIDFYNSFGLVSKHDHKKPLT